MSSSSRFPPSRGTRQGQGRQQQFPAGLSHFPQLDTSLGGVQYYVLAAAESGGSTRAAGTTVGLGIGGLGRPMTVGSSVPCAGGDGASSARSVNSLDSSSSVAGVAVGGPIPLAAPLGEAPPGGSQGGDALQPRNENLLPAAAVGFAGQQGPVLSQALKGGARTALAAAPPCAIFCPTSRSTAARNHSLLLGQCYELPAAPGPLLLRDGSRRRGGFQGQDP